jgi:hypothetical protein
MIDRGHGSALIRLFVDDLLKAGAPRTVTDPIRATRAPSGPTKKLDSKKTVWWRRPTAALFSWYATYE